jgi:predicted O-methyltransferase YrrM
MFLCEPVGVPRVGKLTQALRLEGMALSVLTRSAMLVATAPFRRLDRHLLWRLYEMCFGSQQPGIYPEKPLALFMDDTTAVTVANLPASSFNVSECELLALAAFTARVRAGRVFEIGTADGRTTRNFALNVAPGGQVFSLNLELDQDRTHHQTTPVGSRFAGTPEAAKITQLWGDSRLFDFTPYAGTCQVVFIDADHSDEGVTHDSERALSLVDKARGVILWHDALRYGVKTALPRLGKSLQLPVCLIAGTNLAVLCYREGKPAEPEQWASGL